MYAFALLAGAKQIKSESALIFLIIEFKRCGNKIQNPKSKIQNSHISSLMIDRA
jgi:hypothetical protein